MAHSTGGQRHRGTNSAWPACHWAPANDVARCLGLHGDLRMAVETLFRVMRVRSILGGSRRWNRRRRIPATLQTVKESSNAKSEAGSDKGQIRFRQGYRERVGQGSDKGLDRDMERGLREGRWFVNIAGCGFDALVQNGRTGVSAFASTAAYLAAVVHTLRNLSPPASR